MAIAEPDTKDLCAEYSAEDARTMKSLRSIVQTALLQMVEIEQQTLAKEADRPPKGSVWVKVFLADNSHETTYDDGTVTCDDATKQVCCTGACPC
ncbi:MAG TPA: hypothetical protein VFO09_06155 [Methyloceanibacter sp.]|nr:hypothetical protein [Methyloceanibacter sp.]